MPHPVFGNHSDYYFGEVVYEPGGTCGPRVQRNVQVVIVHEGCANITIGDGGAPLHLGRGEARMFVPGFREVFTFSKSCETRHTWCEAVHPVLPDATVRALAALPAKVRLTPRMEQILRLGLDTPTETPNGRYLREALAIALFEAYFAEAGYTHDESERLPEPIRRALAFIRQNYAQSGIDHAQIATAAGASAQHLSRLFKQHMGRTPVQELWRLRLETGVKLLQTTGLNVSEIADRCGYQSPFHFSRMARNAYGKPPREIRKQSWQDS